MAEIFKQSPLIELAGWRKTADKIGQKIAPFSLGLGAVGTVAAVAAGSALGVAVGGTLMFSDWKQYRERDKAPQDKSIFNIETILNKLGIGTKTSNTRSALAAGAA